MSEQQPRSDDDERRRRREDTDRFAGGKDESLRSRDVTEGPDKAPHRAMFRAMGFDDEDLSSPIVGVPNPAADITPCNVHLDDVADAALDGIDAAGGMPIEFGTITISDAISMGIPPAASMPSSAASATSSRWTLHGVMSAAGFGTPTIGEERSSSSNPIARNIDRCGARAAPSVTSLLGKLSSFSPANRSASPPRRRGDSPSSDGDCCSLIPDPVARGS